MSHLRLLLLALLVTSCGGSKTTGSLSVVCGSGTQLFGASSIDVLATLRMDVRRWNSQIPRIATALGPSRSGHTIIAKLRRDKPVLRQSGCLALSIALCRVYTLCPPSIWISDPEI